MGAANAKFINPLSSNFKRDSRKQTSANGTRMLVGVCSNSLDSIGTALSFGAESKMESEQPSRASSLDNLHLSQSHVKYTHCNGRRYVLLDNESVVSSVIGLDSGGEGKSLSGRETPSRTQHRLPLSRTKSDPLSSRSVCVRDPDTFSDNFVSVESNEDRPRSMMEAQDSPVVAKGTSSKPAPGRSILKDTKAVSFDESMSALRDDPNFLSKLLADCPQITPSVLAKLSPEEWDQVVSFACANLGKSLQLIKRLSDSHAHSSTPQETSSSGAKHVTISDQVSLYDHQPAGRDPPTHERHRHRRRRKDRPTSLPSTYQRTEEPHPLWSGESEREYTRARANSHEGHHHHRCSAESGRPRKSNLSSSRSRRKKAAKAQRNPSALVDVSLDDNCPGVARVRRVHRHTHHHHYPEKGEGYRETRVTKHESLDDGTTVFDSSLQTVPTEGAELSEGWNELVCPGTSRSGRDSPATDMAVFNLDLNHPSMLVPIRPKKLNNNHTHQTTPPPQVMLHSHNHYHHIIHHAQT